MEFKHTPAPWDLNKRQDGFNIVDGDNSGFVAHVPKQDNANLIAAAPELLQALIEMQRNGRKQGWDDKYESSMEKTRLAIAKALGQQ
ncbi:hypothetical protein [Proteus terrae]|uniref:hypothetical protein n=1 Tax=Proteus terrae TaxID=1574161 RepID=UPI00298D5A35|nr:hypothetical protein [Proteus terrae]WPD00346.1 hypothetical protein R5P25_07500 [Proteus terrae]